MAMHIYDLGWMLAQVLLLLCSAPLVAGIIKKVKALLQLSLIHISEPTRRS